MSEYVIVSARIRKELREEMKRLGIKPSEVIKHAIEESIRRKKVEILRSRFRDAGKILRKVGREEWVKAIRESREGR